MKTLWRIENDRLRLSLHPGQAAGWRSDRRFVFLFAGSQGGKTSFGPWWLWREIRNRGAGDYLAVTASYDLFKLKMLPEIRNVFEHLLGVGRYWSGERLIELKDPVRGFLAKRADDTMWGRIILRSAEAPSGLESATASAAWLDECGQDAFTLETWEAIQRRLALNEGRVLGTTTLYNVGWLKNEVYDLWRDGDQTFDVVQYASTVNPAFPPKEFDRLKARLPDWRFRMFYLGQFARPAGLIYADFTDDMLVDPFPIPAEWPHVIGVDFGGANQAALWLAGNPETGAWYIYREYLEGGRTSAEHVKAALDGLGEAKEYQAIGGASSESQQRRDWAAAGLAVKEPTIDGVEPGIDRVTALIKENRLRVFRTCKGTRDEFGSYRRKLDAAGEPTDEIVDKRTFHRLDALRYAATEIGSPSWLIW